MGINEGILVFPLEDRLSCNEDENLFLANFEGFSIISMGNIQDIKDDVERILKPLGKKVYTIINYQNFTIHPELFDPYPDMVKNLVDELYSGVSRYTTSTFYRMKIEEALKERNVVPHIYETLAEASQALKKM